ncbi:MAG: carboxypeptidase regulatory-like domain-containing protein [Bryobacterales bacterium]|nr:carboxypeptidase regulatory-like domain-containing protein [Bryobacterales bacterium]
MLRILFSLTLLALPLAAQSSYGRLAGRVIDQQGAVVPNVDVRATQTNTNIQASTKSNDNGLFDLPSLLPGEYIVTLEAAGFKKYTRSGMTVRVGDIVDIDIELEVGGVTESVSVTAEAPLLETGSASLGNVVDQRMITEMPLAGRGVNYLMLTSPGVISTNAPMHGWLPQARDSVSNISVAGARTRSTEFTLDGIPNMARSGIMAFQPPPEMVQEFRVQTAAYDASIGHFTGANVNMVLRSGTNDYHGTLWFSHLSRPLMTHPFFINSNLHNTASDRPGESFAEKRTRLWPPSLTNRYRVQVGGPVVLPKLYNGRNRTFFSYGNEIMVRNFNNQSNVTVPTAEQRNGDFSALLRLGAAYQIYDPAPLAAAPNGRVSRQPLAGNIIPASRISPIARNILQYYPLPNAPGTADFRNNFVTATPALIDYKSHMLRVDQMVNDKNRFYVSYSIMKTEGDQGRTLNNDAVGNLSTNNFRALAVDHVWTPRSDTVVNLRYGLNRSTNNGRPPTRGLDLASLGFPSSFVNTLDREYTALPEIVIGGLVSVGTNLINRGGYTNQYWNGSVSRNSGVHTIRAGGEFRLLQDNNRGFGNYSGIFNFANAWTRGPLDNSPVSPIGQGMATFLFGLPTGGGVDLNDSAAETSNYTGLFLNDDWKLSRKLTLNLGLRYELEGPIVERFNRANRGLDLDSINPADAAARAAYARSPIPQIPVDQFRLRGGILFAGSNGSPRTMWDPDRNNLSPRIGFAYQATTRTVLRGGYGVFFEPLGSDVADVDQTGYSQRTNLNPSSDNGLTFRATLANPFPTGYVSPQRDSAGLATNLGLSLSPFYQRRKNAYMQRWSFNIQRQLAPNLLLEIGYIGNRGTGLGVSRDFNVIPAQYLSRSPERDQANIDFLSTNVANPFRGIPEFANSPGFQNNVNLARSQLLRPYPHFGSMSMALSEGFSWYHAGSVRLDRRFARGFSIGGHWTWSKFMEAIDLLNAQDLHPHHVVSPQDRPHHITVNGMWELPFGKGRTWLNTRNGIVNTLAGGWSINAIYQWQSGPPIGFGNVLFRGDIQDLVIPRSERTVARWFNIDAGFERNPQRALESNYRTFPLRFTGLRAHGWDNWDLSLYKSIAFTERIKLQLRAEAVDAFNTAMFNPPNTDPNNTLFGQVTGTIWSEQRKITVAARLTF